MPASTSVTGKCRGGRAAIKEILRHLHRDRLWKRGYPGFGDAMIGDEDYQRGPIHDRRGRTLRYCDLRGQILEPAERTRRLGLAVDQAPDMAREKLCIGHIRSGWRALTESMTTRRGG